MYYCSYIIRLRKHNASFNTVGLQTTKQTICNKYMTDICNKYMTDASKINKNSISLCDITILCNCSVYRRRCAVNQDAGYTVKGSSGHKGREFVDTRWVQNIL